MKTALLNPAPFRITRVAHLCCLAMLALTVLDTPFVFGSGVNGSRLKTMQKDKRSAEKGNWIYNDLNGALDQARQTKNPVIVVLRCVV